jgi:predicted PurR-regulated permease PerM
MALPPSPLPTDQPTEATPSQVRLQLWHLAWLASGMLMLLTWAGVAFYFYNVMVLLSLSLLVTYVLLGPVNTLEQALTHLERFAFSGKKIPVWLKKGLLRPRVLAIVLLYTSLGLLCLLGVNRGLPLLLAQGKELLNALPGYSQQASQWLALHPLPWLGNSWLEGSWLESLLNTAPKTNGTLATGSVGNPSPSQAAAVLQNLSSGLASLSGTTITNVLEKSGDWLSSSLNQLIFAVALAVIPFYFLLDGKTLLLQLLKALPASNKSMVRHALHDTDRVLKAYVLGQVLLGLLTGVYMFIVYTLFGVPYAIVLGLVFCLAELIPVAGTWLGIIPGLLISFFTGGPWVAFFVWLCSYLYQTLKDNIIAPKITGDVMGLHPAFVMLALLLGVKLAGLMGLLMAIPVAGMLKALWLRLLTLQPVEPPPAAAPTHQETHPA